MGRRARTNCSPIDSAMEKYYNDIGNRLSGVFLPPQPADGSGQLSHEFSMLTLDTRQMNNAKKSQPRGPAAVLASINNVLVDSKEDTSSEASGSAENLLSTTSSGLGTLSSISNGDQENLPKEKQRLVDKLTRALFQKKHMCARCKRRSRNCMPNKTFNGTGKHYMCGDCRESSNAVKTLFVDQSSSQDSELSDSRSMQSSSSSLAPPKSKELVIPVPRNLNDSGYETVTSCSTVASAYSAFNCPDNTNSNANSDGTNGKPTQFEDQQFNAKRNSNTPNYKESNEKYNENVHTHCVCSDHDTTSKTPANNGSELCQFMGVGQHGSAGVLRQVKHRNIQDYDGYLPEPSHHGWSKNEDIQPFSDATNIEGDVFYGDCSYNRITIVSEHGKKQSPAQKACYTCESTTAPCFRLPWEDGWICEDCLDYLH